MRLWPFKRKPKTPPPTDRQLAFIERLLKETGVPRPPYIKDRDEASQVINILLKVRRDKLGY